MIKRRDFVKTAGVAAAGWSLSQTTPTDAVQAEQENPMQSMPMRPYGKSKQMLSMIGFGGIVVMNAEQSQANQAVADAVAAGVNYFDVAPSYGDAEIKLGPALEPFRDRVFLACKTAQRDRAAAEQEFQQSLERLRTDHFDLYQLHAIMDVEKDVDQVFAQGGLMDFLRDRQQAGQIRHLGFSAHTEEAALAALDRFDFDSVLIPVNFACIIKGRFGQRMIDKAVDKGASILALKMMARQKWPENSPLREQYAKCWYEPLTEDKEIVAAMRFTFSQPVTAALPPGDEYLFRQALALIGEVGADPVADEAQLAALAEPLDPIFSVS